MPKKSLLLILFSITLLQSTSPMTHSFKLLINPFEEECFHELFQELELVNIEINSNINVDFDLFSTTNSEETFKKTKIMNFKYSITTEQGGFMTICIGNSYAKDEKTRQNDEEHEMKYKFQKGIEKMNENKEENEGNLVAHVEINIKYGVSAKDFSQMTTVKKLKPIEYMLNVLELKSEELMRLGNYRISDSSSLVNSIHEVLKNIDFFTLLVIVTIIIVSILEYIHIKYYYLARKTI